VKTNHGGHVFFLLRRNVTALPFKDPNMPIDNECLNRAREIRERLVQLKDSL